MYVAIEGIDTAGKSTQIEALRARFDDAVITKEPGGTPTGSRIRDIVLHGEVKSPTAELLLFLADRSEHIEEVILPNRHRLIISDRSVLSGLAYAMVQKRFDAQQLVALNRFATAGILPEHAFLLKLSETELASRLAQKEHDAIESRGTDYLLQIQEALIEAAELLQIELTVIDASQSIETITAHITTSIKGNQ
jgi:dTMP kinase